MFFVADTQTVFYTVGIVFMIFFMVVAVVFLIMMAVFMARVNAMRKRAQQRVDSVFGFFKKGKGFMDGFRRGMGQ